MDKDLKNAIHGHEGSIPFTRFRSLLPRELERGTACHLQPVAGFVRPKERKRRAVVPLWRDEGGQYDYALRMHSGIAHRPRGHHSGLTLMDH
jgi:hypothetical protein